MDEEKFSKRITSTLDWGLTKIDESQLARLRLARTKALVAYPKHISLLGLATVSGPVFLSRQNMLRKAWFFMPFVILLTTFLMSNFSNDEAIDPNIDIDAALLGHELPIQAFLDKDVDAWIKSSE